ncbi:ribosomal-protein-alanine N-acetyltransferase [Pseudothauera rhizosphaerae]|uniref:[Ribosomal protein bS18]-alanine N-acetyltransferase n=2 Tax=Pseudothauera rhizosphaerae TaxID=2565932 RepID=A0A4S4ABB4_9RHOO|nr:ribosomal-protein-alanine N-acetyltransferase [Pseudothauera rhizosphaerae]
MSEADLEWVTANEAELHPYPWTRGNFADSLGAGYSAWIQSDGGHPCGYAVVLSVLDEAHLLNISVARGAQGRGLGGALLDFLCARARASGATQFFLEVRPSNQPALALYRRTGFEPIGRRKGYYPAPGGREDAIVMRLPL